MRKLILVLACIPSLARADDWQALAAADITPALSAKVLDYGDGTSQSFNADGSTIYTAERPSTGSWRVDGAQYCSVWPPSDRWSCYDVARSADGGSLRFTASDGSQSDGRYVDPK